MPDTYCCLTKIGLSSQNSGHASVCNLSRNYLHDSDNQIIRFDTHSLIDAWNSPTRKEIDESLSNGIQHPNCQECWDEEAAGRTSKRQHYNRDLGSISVLENQPRVIILKPGNTCNLGCRHCDPSVSSGWYRDAYKLSESKNSYNDWIKSFQHIKESYDTTNPNFWPILDSWTQNLVYYDLFGGEPLLTPRLYQNLELSAANGYAANQVIHINTNGTIWHDNFNKVFSKFKCVYFDISSDGINEQFEYMRYPAKWSEFQNNLQKYLELSKLYPSIFISVTVTISLYNIFDLPTIVEFYEKLGLNVSLNILHQPEYLNIRIIPKYIKEYLTKELTDNAFVSIVNFLNLDIDNHELLFKQFFKHVEKIDNIRGQNFRKIFPKLETLLHE